MKVQITGILFLFCLSLWMPWRLYSQTCTMTINSSVPYIDASASPYNSIKPGDTVCLKAGNWDYIYLRNFHGTAQKPITFVNTGGAVVIKAIVKPNNYYGIKIGGCSHIIFRGNGVSGIQYGFQVDTVAAGAGMSVGDLSTNIEVSYVEISHTDIGGVYAKTDPTCSDFSSTRDKFTMYDFSFHNCYVHDVPNEGLYIGNSHFTGFTPQGGCDTTVYAQVLKGVHIYENLIKNTGYDGIQVSSADSDCQIHDNRIYSDSYQGTPDQMSGILIGGGSKCNTYNNMIFGGEGDGIDVFGLGNFKIFNNLIVNSGQNYYPNNPTKMKHGIYVGTDSTSANATLGIYNNTIVSPKSFGINLNNSQLDTISVINNLIVDPGAYSTDGSQSFINTTNLNTNPVIVKKTNDTSENIATVNFIDANTMNYDLQSTSPAVNFGTNLTAEGITFDILNRKRPSTGSFDAGAYQPESSTGVINHSASDVQSVKVYPNPASQLVQLELIMKTSQTVNITFSDAMGRILFIGKLACEAMQTYHYDFNVAACNEGWYFLNIFTKNGKKGIPIIVQH